MSRNKAWVATFWSAELNWNDERIEALIASIEDVTGQEITHYLSGISQRPIPEQRSIFISRWIAPERDPDRKRPKSSTLMTRGFGKRSILIGITSSWIWPSQPLNQKFGWFTVELTADGYAKAEIEELVKRAAQACRSSGASLQAPLEYFQSALTIDAFEKLMELCSSEAERELLETRRNSYRYGVERPLVHHECASGYIVQMPVSWINVLSEITARQYGFPGSADYDKIFSIVQVDGVGWIMKLTADPLDFDRLDHCEIISWAQTRFVK